MYLQLTCFLLTSCFLKMETVADDFPFTRPSIKNYASNYLPKALMKFASDLLKNLQEETNTNENILFSPVNVYSALSMVHLGASNTSRDELAAVLGWQKFNNEKSVLHENFGKMLKSYGKSKSGKELTRVNIANGIFVQKYLPIKDNYLKEIKQLYNGEVRNLDFTNGIEATENINKWVFNATEGKIQKLISEPLESDTMMMIATSLYFNGRWDEAFSKHKTRKDLFMTSRGAVDVQMMNQIAYMPYVNNTSLQFEAVQLVYDGGDYSMFFILPYASQTLINLTRVLNEAELQKLTSQTESKGIDCKIPKIKFSMKKSLVKPLQKQGLKNIFNHATFDNMVIQGPELRINDVKHAAEIELDEFGTKASAITAVQISYLSGPIIPSDPIKFHINRPFMLGLFHHTTSSFLFIGLVNHPAV